MGDTNAPRRPSLAQCDYIKFQRAFDAVAGKGKSTITGQQLVKLASKVGYTISEEKVKEILKHHELSLESEISFKQFIDIIPCNAIHIDNEEHRLAELREKFARYDVDGNGRINLQEAQWALQGELQVTPQTALRLLNQFVQLDYVQFAHFYQQVQKKKVEIFDKFGKYDKNQDGMISLEEAHEVLQKELGFDETKSRALVERFDVNKDGCVSYIEFTEFYLAVEEKKNQIRHSFKRFDSTQCGYVTLEQARHILMDLLGFSEEKCQAAIDTYDKDQNGKIDYEEFVDFYCMVEEEQNRLLRQFKLTDVNGDGLISKDELKDMLDRHGYSKNITNTLLKGYGTYKDGYLNFDEFKKFINYK